MEPCGSWGRVSLHVLSSSFFFSSSFTYKGLSALVRTSAVEVNGYRYAPWNACMDEVCTSKPRGRTCEQGRDGLSLMKNGEEPNVKQGCQSSVHSVVVATQDGTV